MPDVNGVYYCGSATDNQSCSTNEECPQGQYCAANSVSCNNGNVPGDECTYKPVPILLTTTLATSPSTTLSTTVSTTTTTSLTSSAPPAVHTNAAPFCNSNLYDNGGCNDKCVCQTSLSGGEYCVSQNTDPFQRCDGDSECPQGAVCISNDPENGYPNACAVGNQPGNECTFSIPV